MNPQQTIPEEMGRRLEFEMDSHPRPSPLKRLLNMDCQYYYSIIDIECWKRHA